MLFNLKYNDLIFVNIDIGVFNDIYLFFEEKLIYLVYLFFFILMIILNKILDYVFFNFKKV